jgi:hypothetical protein
MPRPTFLVIGAAKGGTTSLHHYLRQHPRVHMPAAKEINYYWDDAAAAGREVPGSFAEYVSCFAGASDGQAIGEISPQYLNSRTAASRIRADLPDVKLVVSLRHPADRAYSDYLGRVRIGREHREFGAATASGERIREDGFYGEKLARYVAHFPREQLLVILHDDYARDTAGTLRQLFAFIGVDPDVAVDTGRRYNRAELPRSARLSRVMWAGVGVAQQLLPRSRRGTGLGERLLRTTYRKAPPFPAEQRAAMVEVYRDDIVATAALIGRDLSAWLRQS